MIASLSGTVQRIYLDSVIIESGGVGFQVFATPKTLSGFHTDTPATLLTELIVRDDSLSLYGFTSADEQELFLLLQKVSGIGPRMAMQILAVLDPTALSQAILNGDTAALMKVPGVGKRVSERLIVELKDKVDAVTTLPAATEQAGMIDGNTLSSEVSEALTSLGFSHHEITSVVAAVMDSNPTADSATVLRQSLIRLGGRS